LLRTLRQTTGAISRRALAEEKLHPSKREIWLSPT
jgi:hypothetical protein